MILGDGTAVCDRCGGYVGGSVSECAVVTVTDSDRQIVSLHFCLADDDTHQRCAATLLPPEMQTRLLEERGADNPLVLYTPPAAG